MAKKHTSEDHYRNVAKGNSGHGAHAKPTCMRYNPRIHTKKSLSQRLGKLGAMAFLGTVGLGAGDCSGPEIKKNYLSIGREDGSFKRAIKSDNKVIGEYFKTEDGDIYHFDGEFYRKLKIYKQR